MNNPFESIPLVMVFTAPAYLLPLILGPVILGKYKGEAGKMAGWFTLKPIAATPLWVIAVGLLDNLELNEEIAALISILPAVLLTLLIAWRFRLLFKSPDRFAFILVGADAVRWLNTLAWMISDGRTQWMNPFYVAGLILPNAYALLSFLMARERSG